MPDNLNNPTPATSTGPRIPESASDAEDWFSDAPGGDQDLDTMFSLDQTPDQGLESPTEPVAQPPAPQEPFLKAASTVYETPEDAIRGTDEKDRIIRNVTQNREQIAKALGVDPISGEVVQRDNGQPQAVAPVEKSYEQDPNAYVSDLQKAAADNNSQKFFEIHQKLVAQELDKELDRRLGPVVPIVTSFAKQHAIEKIGADPKSFNSFLAGEDFKAVVEELPLLREAISLAENDIAQAAQLPGLYRMAYLTSLGLKQQAPAAGQPVPVASIPPVRPRPTSSSSTMAPPTIPGTEPDQSTKEGRAEIIRRAEAAGVDNLKW